MPRSLPVLALAVSALWFVILSAGAGLAQGTSSGPPTRSASTSVNFETWESVARRAEAAVDEGVDDTSVFTSLRDRIAGFRDRFDLARQTNAERIATLRSQLDALGPAPEEGQTEATDISDRRSELQRQLAEAQAPVQAAQEAFTRADGIIAQIDAIIRERQTERLLTLGPTPLNPASWPTAITEIGLAISKLLEERRMFSDPMHLSKARDNLPLTGLLMVVAAVLLTRGRIWALKLGNTLRRFGGRGTGVWGFVVSLLRIILPLAGVFALTSGISSSGMVGLRIQALMEELPAWALVLLGYRWLAERLFASNDDDAVILLDPAHRASARFYVTILAMVLVLRGFFELLFSFVEVSRTSQAVISFPIVLVLGLLLYRIGGLLRGLSSHQSETAAAEGGNAVNHSFALVVRWLGRALQIVSIASPLMAAIGYAAVSNALMYPTILSFGLLGFVAILQHFAGDVYGLITGQGKAARDSLMAILISFLLLLAAAPLLALIWGARVSDLNELWFSFLRGFELGDTRISPVDFLTFAIIFVGGFMLTRLFQRALRTSVLPKTKFDVGAQNAMVSGVGYLGIFLAGIIAVTGAGIDLSALAIVAGALSLGIGIGLQNIVGNFVSGIILLIERPISEGDWIEVGGQHGYVRSISVRSTRIETFDRTDVIVPNQDLISGTVTNYTRGNTVGRVIVPVGVAYGTDTRKVDEILRKVAEDHPMVLLDPPPAIIFQGFGASSLDFEIRAILRDVNWMVLVKSEMNHKIAEYFTEEGIEIPFPQQDVWLRNPEAIGGRGAGNKRPSRPPEALEDQDRDLPDTSDTDFAMDTDT